MNAVVNSAAVDNGVCGSDSDSNSDDLPEYYHPISTANNSVGEDEDEDEDEDGEDPSSDLDLTHHFHHLPNGLSPLDLSDDDEHEDDEEEEAETESERAIERAFREDERRRIAPLTADNAVRVMEAMRRISFGGNAPEWAARVPEDQWIDHLRSLSRPSN